MPIEPPTKQVVTFVDGQNLYHSVREAFGYPYPNYDVMALSKAICANNPGWQLKQVRFYTGIPDQQDDARWHYFWSGKLAVMGRQGIHVFSRHLRYRNKLVHLPDGTTHTFLSGEEKGIDVRIAIDVIRLGHHKEYDVALIFSQDQDLSEVAKEIRAIAAEQGRWLKVACAFPSSPTRSTTRGIEKTDWIRFDRSVYDSCLDRRDYRPSGSSDPTR